MSKPDPLSEILIRLMKALQPDNLFYPETAEESRDLSEAKSQLQSYFVEEMEKLIGGDLGGRFYTTRKLKEIDGLTAVNNYKAQLRANLKSRYGGKS